MKKLLLCLAMSLLSGYLLNAQTNKSVNVTEAGSLSALLTDTEQDSVEKLTISGYLNGSDIKFIRELAKNKKLEYLYMQNSQILSGGDAYYNDGYQLFTSSDTIGKQMFFNLDQLKYISIPESTRSIEDKAFLNCTHLERIILSQDLNSIGIRAFENCLMLNLNPIPDGVKEIKESAFANCQNLRYLSISKNTTSISDSAFYNCNALRSIELGNKLLHIGENAFALCTKLSEINIPNSIVSMGKGTFNGCVSLKQLKLPKNLTRISSQIFQDCSDLTYISLPPNISYIEEQAFMGCGKLSVINCLNPEPPTCHTSSFDEATYLVANIKVPENSLEKYRNAAIWEKFLSIEKEEKEVFPTSDATWAIVTTGGYSDPKVYSLQGDTIINNLTYQKLYLLKDTIPSINNSDEYIAAIRQTNKKVWIKPAILSNGFEFNEYLLYDFSVSYGEDIIFGDIPFINPHDFTFESVNTTYLKTDVTAKVITDKMSEWGRTLSISSDYGRPTEWIEGIGSLYGLFFQEPLQTTCGREYGTLLTCMKKGNKIIYKNPKCEKCFDSFNSNIIEDIKQINADIKYIRETQSIEITFQEPNFPLEFSLVSVEGKLSYRINIDELYTSISTNQLQKGTYIYLIKGINISETGKLIVN